LISLLQFFINFLPELIHTQVDEPNFQRLTYLQSITVADPITFTVMIGVAVTVIVVDECYRAYKKRKVRKNMEREMGITPENRREFRRLRREREREMRRREREYRQLVRAQQRARADGTWNDLGLAEPDEFNEVAGMGLPEYSLRPRDGVDRAVTAQVAEELTTNGQRKKGLRKLFKRRQSEPEPIIEGEVQRLQKRKKGWFRKKGRRAEEQGRALMMEGPPPPYDVIAGDIEGESVPGTSEATTRSNSHAAY
jgi:hypothetical protein